MAIDIKAEFLVAYGEIQAKAVGIDSVYLASITKLEELFTKSGITSADKSKYVAQVAAQVAASISNSTQQTALEVVRQDHLLEQELLNMQAQVDISAKDIILKQAQIDIAAQELALVTAKIALIDEQTQTEDKKNEIGGLLDKEIAVKVAQETLVASQKLSEDKKNELNGLIDKQIAMTVRQTQGFDDKVRQENTKSVGNVLSLSSAASGTIDVGLLSTHKDTINKSYVAIGDTAIL